MRERGGESATVSAYVDNLAESEGLPWLPNTKRSCSIEDNQKHTHTHTQARGRGRHTQVGQNLRD